MRMVVLKPASRAAQRLLSDQDAIQTVMADNGCGPACPSCRESMHPIPGYSSNIVRCNSADCIFSQAPFMSSTSAVVPVKDPLEPEEAEL